MKILILFGHPAFQNSAVNKKLVEGLDEMENVTFHDLYETYPEMDIDIDAEQELMEEHDIIVFHHPMYWYSSPAIFKEWQDLVLEHGWAYGSEGNALKGKYFFSALTTGSPRAAFKKEGFQKHRVLDFLVPFQQMADLCGMIFLPPFVIHGTHIMTADDIVEGKNNYHKILKALSKDEVHPSEALDLEYLNMLNPKSKDHAR